VLGSTADVRIDLDQLIRNTVGSAPWTRAREPAISAGDKPRGGTTMTRETLRQSGEATLQRLLGSTGQPRGLANLLTEPVYGGVWNRPGLALSDRLLCTIAALATGPRTRSLRIYINAGLEHGLDAAAIREILVQASLYAGFSSAEETLPLLAEILGDRDIPFPDDPPEEASLEELTRRGAALMSELHGARALQGYAAPDNPVTGALYPTAIQYGYGEIWFRPAWIAASGLWSPSPDLPLCACRNRSANSANPR
jgi:4-carboxymuconolactone decarboxylase